MPEEPEALARIFTASTLAASLISSSFAINSKAKSWRASPAKIAFASPNLIWLESLPLRISSSSMLGKSSWINEYVWINSTEHAKVIKLSLVKLSFRIPEAITNPGLIALLLLRTEYLIASSIRDEDEITDESLLWTSSRDRVKNLTDTLFIF